MKNIVKTLLMLPLMMTFTLTGCKKSVTPSNPQPVEPSEPSEPEVTKFPVDELKAFFSSVEMDVEIPEYVCASEEVIYETDDSFEGYFDVYVTGSNHDEMVAYKDALIGKSWSVIGENEGDYRLQFGETKAFVDLLDYEDYIDCSFFYEVEGSGTEYTTSSAADAIAEHMSQYFTNPISAHHDDGDYIILNMGTSVSVDTMKTYVTNLFIHPDFTLVGEWQTGAFSDGTEVQYIFASASTVYAEYDVYQVTEGSYAGTYLQIGVYDLPSA